MKFIAQRNGPPSAGLRILIFFSMLLFSFFLIASSIRDYYETLHTFNRISGSVFTITSPMLEELHIEVFLRTGFFIFSASIFYRFFSGIRLFQFILFILATGALLPPISLFLFRGFHTGAWIAFVTSLLSNGTMILLSLSLAAKIPGGGKRKDGA